MLSRKHNLNTRYYYTTLNREEKRLYRAIVENFLNFNYDFAYDVPWIRINVVKAYQAVLDDWPELYYVEHNALDWGREGRFKLLYKVKYSKSEILKLNEKLERILRKFDEIKDPFELQVAVTDFICDEYVYFKEAKGKKAGLEIFTVAGLLKRKKGVCAAFSKLAQFIFQRRGIPVAYLVAESTDLEDVPEGENYHAWLAVKHENSYYHWDITAIHSNSKDAELNKYDKFNITDKEMIESGYAYDPTLYKGVVCDKTDYNYYRRKGLYYDSYEGLYNGYMGIVKGLDYSKEVNWFEARVSPEIDGEADNYLPKTEDIKKVVEPHGYAVNRFETSYIHWSGGYYKFKIVTKKKLQLKLTAIQPDFKRDENACKEIIKFLQSNLLYLEKDELAVLPEYSNAGGVADAERLKGAAIYADEIKKACAKTAKERSAYVAVNVLENRKGKLKNSTYLYGKNGKVAFVYDKVHLTREEKELGVERGTGACTVVLSGIRFAFITGYDAYFSEQIEEIALFKPDVIIFPSRQTGELANVIRAQATLIAYRSNAFVVRSDYSTGKEHLGGNSMIVKPIGQTAASVEGVGSASFTAENIFSKCYRPTGFDKASVLTDEYVNEGLCPEVFALPKIKK
ncbi:MAG: hypothetical protein J6B04_05670 [Clostridia bacterium]|nr:hypothetical protein [Clostridia bacterium]